MRALRPFLALALGAALLGSCSRRERLNPLDPGNPSSGGAPEGFNAIGGHAHIQLRWTPRHDLSIEGFQLEKLAPGDSEYRPLGGLQPANSTGYIDGAVVAGQDHHYRLYYVNDGAISSRPAEDVAAPGIAQPWAVDGGSGRLLALSPDGRDVVRVIIRMGDAFSLAVTPGGGAVWVGDNLAGRVNQVDPQTFLVEPIMLFSRPFTMALDPFDASVWVCDLGGFVRHITAAGTPAMPSTIPSLLEPGGIATDPGDGTVWIVDRGGDLILRYARDGTLLGSRPVSRPSRVAVDSTTGDAWVTSLSSGWVWRMSPSFVDVDSVRLSGPIGIAVDCRRRTVWVADAASDQLVAVDPFTCAVRSIHPAPAEPRDVSVDLDRGEAWVAARVTGSIYRFAPNGQRLAQLNGLGDLYEVKLDRGYP